MTVCDWKGWRLTPPFAIDSASAPTAGTRRHDRFFWVTGMPHKGFVKKSRRNAGFFEPFSLGGRNTDTTRQWEVRRAVSWLGRIDRQALRDQSHERDDRPWLRSGSCECTTGVSPSEIGRRAETMIRHRILSRIPIRSFGWSRIRTGRSILNPSPPKFHTALSSDHQK
jgi:hypothetical protein